MKSQSWYLHGLSEGGDDLHVHPLPCRFLPFQMLLEPLVEVLDRLEVAEANHQAILVGGEGVYGIILDHLSSTFADGSLQLPEVRKSGCVWGELLFSCRE